MNRPFPKIAQLKDVAAFRQRLRDLDLDLPTDDQVLPAATSPLAESWSCGGRVIGNRWCIHPMEGWDANPDGSPSPPHLAALATLRAFRRQIDLGWRSGSRTGRWSGESAADPGHPPKTCRGCISCSRRCCRPIVTRGGRRTIYWSGCN